MVEGQQSIVESTREQQGTRNLVQNLWIAARTVLTHPCVRSISTSVCVRGRNDGLLDWVWIDGGGEIFGETKRGLRDSGGCSLQLMSIGRD